MTRDELIASVVGTSNGWTPKKGVAIPEGMAVAKRREAVLLYTCRDKRDTWDKTSAGGPLLSDCVYIRPKRKKDKPAAAFSQPDPAPPAITPGQIYTTSPFGSITPEEEAHLAAELKRYREEIKVGDWAVWDGCAIFPVIEKRGEYLIGTDSAEWSESQCTKIPPSHYPALEAAMAAARGEK